MSSGPNEDPEQTDYRAYYTPPASPEAAPPPREPAAGVKDYGFLGLVIGGCYLPCGVLAVTTVLRDPSGPTMCLLLAVPMAIAGYALGTCIPRRPGPKPPRSK
jgi:hypothetical protein